MVVLSKKTDFNQPLMNLMDIHVKINSYGRQKDSFEAPIKIFNQDFPCVFIRAPILNSYDETKKDIEILSEYNDEIMVIKQSNNIAVSFHHELTDNPLIYEFFIRQLIDD